MSDRKPPEDQPFVLRVASFSNFNHTSEERAEVLKLLRRYPKAMPFVNTCSGDRLMVADWPIFITGNPYLDEFIPPSKKDPGFKSIKAVRLKYVHGAVPKVREAFIEGLEWCNANGIPALITLMRFSRIALMYRYVEDPTETYGDGGDFRARTNKRYTLEMAKKELPERTMKEKEKKHRVIEAMGKGIRFFLPFVPPWSQFKAHIRKDLYYVCDGKLRGCPWCQNCNWLTYGKRDFRGVNDEGVMPPWVPYQVNLRASKPRGGRISPKGNPHCHHDCPDCFARKLLAQTGGVYSLEVGQNDKQKGATSHPFLREFQVAKYRQREVAKLLAERKAGWPTMAPETPPFKPGLATMFFGWLPGLLPSPATDTQWVDHAIDALDKYDDFWVPGQRAAESWHRERMEGWSKAERKARDKARTATNKILAKYAIEIRDNLEERFTAAFDERTKKMGLKPDAMAAMIREETELLRSLVDQLKAGGFATLEDYISHLNVTSEVLGEAAKRKLTKAGFEATIAQALAEGAITEEEAKLLGKGGVPKVSAKRLRGLATKARSRAERVRKEVLRGV